MNAADSAWMLRVDQGEQALGLDVTEYGEMNYRRDFWEP